MQYQFIRENSCQFKVDEMCECFSLSRSGYYDWKEREPSNRATEDTTHKARIAELHHQARGRYGHRPSYHHLLEEGRDCGRDRTLRLMKEMGIEGIQKTGFKPMGTDSSHEFGYCPNLLEDEDRPERCDQVWVSDTTYLKVEAGWCYLATVMDLFSRRIIGWSISDHNDSALVCQALRGAVLTRGGKIDPDLIHHSDRGSTYAGHEYGRLLGSLRIKQSMSRKGNCYDNAAMESFYGRYKSSSVRGVTFMGEDQARANAFEYIEIFYNRFRKHASLGYENPVEFEGKFSPPMGGEPPASLQACTNNN
ncbi:MAG TPA: IS3 family transposase [Nitrospira sp.]|nr:IS3 family transposase [Candidatus Manganitrophaceae bacterium]